MRKIIAVAFVVAVGLLVSGAALHETLFRTPEPRVTEVYTVKAGDTLWGIATRYQPKDGRNIYILDFKSEPEQQNPFLLDRHGVLYPDDDIIVQYVQRRDSQ